MSGWASIRLSSWWGLLQQSHLRIGLLLLWRHVVGARFPQRLLLRDLRRQVRSLALAALPQQHLHLRHHLRLRLALVLGLADSSRLQFALLMRHAEELVHLVLRHASTARIRAALGERPEPPRPPRPPPGLPPSPPSRRWSAPWRTASSAAGSSRSGCW